MERVGNSGLTILGASARAAAYSAARADYTPYTIDSFADRDLAALCTAIRIERYPADFRRHLQAAPHGPWIYTGGLENHPRLVDALATLRPLWGNGGQVLRRVRDPWRLVKALDTAGLATPNIARSATSGSWLLKPLRSSAGLGVRRPAVEEIANPPRGTILQQYIDGPSGSAIFVATKGRSTLLGATRQLVGRDFGLNAEFLYAGSVGPLLLTHAEQAALRKLGGVLAREFCLVGLFGVDFIRTSEQIWPLEVNPRYTASAEILEVTGGQSFLAYHIAACQSGELPAAPTPNSQPRTFAGKAIVYAPHRCQVTAAMPWDKKTEKGAARISALPEFADLPAAGQTIRAGHPVATVLAAGTSPEGVEEALHESVQQVRNALLPG